MIIAVDSTLVTFALKAALHTDNTDEVNYICQRILQSVPSFQRTLCVWLLRDIEDWQKANPDAEYLKTSPIKRLHEAIGYQLKEFRK